MKILHLCSEYPPQFVFGLGRYVFELATTQVAAGHNVTVITNSHGGLDAENDSAGVRLLRVHFPPPPKAPTTAAMLLHFNLQLLERAFQEKLKSDQRFDVIIAHDWLVFPAAFHFAHLSNAPIVTTLHDVVFHKVRGREFNSEDAYIAGIENWACHTSAAIIVLSQTVKNELLCCYHAPESRVHVVPGGVGIAPLLESEFESLAAWRSLLAPNDEELFLYAGRLDPEKGLSVLMAALVALHQRRPSGWKFVIAGSGQLAEQIEEFSKRSGIASSLAILGYLPFDDLRIAYAAADVCVVPSDYEPFGLVALEAQRMGTPVIAANTGGLAETIKITNGGLLFAPGNTTELVERMLQMFDHNARVKLAQCGQQSVATHFNWQRIEKELANVLLSTQGTGGPKNVLVPAWTPPQPAHTIAPLLPAGVESDRSSPLSDITLFWDAAFMNEADALITRIASGHALAALGGTLNVIPIAYSQGGSDSWIPPPETKGLRFVTGKSLERLPEFLKHSAAVVADSRLWPLRNTQMISPAYFPTVWVGKSNSAIDGRVENDAALIFALTSKLLCDERLRKSMAPSLACSIPQVNWIPPSRSKPEVVHVLPQLVTGGAETTLFELVRGAAERYTHHILCLGPLEGPLPDEFRHIGVQITSISAADENAILQFLKARMPDLIHLHSMSYVPTWIPVHRRICSQRIIETEHVVNIGSGHFGPVDIVACVSEATKNAHARFESVWRNAGTTLAVIYNGIDPLDFDSLPSRTEVRTMLGLPLERPIIGRVSALARNKLPQEALESIRRVVETIPNALFVIVGDGPQRKPAEEWVANHGLTAAVVFLGERRDIPRVLRAFDVFAYYTTKDALGNVILEAIAAGIPVVTTDVEGTREALGEAPGELVKLGAFDDFASAVRRWADPEKSRNMFKLPTKFTRRAMADAYSALYDSLTALNRSPTNGPQIEVRDRAQDVSIVMPVFNTKKEWLLEALASIKAQHHPQWKLKLIDDGSDSHYHEWLTRTVKADRRLADRTQILRLASNKGVAAALNAGLHACKTELVARMDADDRMGPDRLALQAAAFERRPQLTVLGGWARLIDESGNPSNGKYSYPCGHRQITQMLSRSCAFAHPTVMYRRSAIVAAGGYSTDCKHYEDYDLWVRLANAGAHFANIPTPLIDYRVHNQSVSQVHREHQAHGAADCADRARKLPLKSIDRRARVVFTGVHHSYGIPGRGLSVEQLFFGRAMEQMPEIELHPMPADDLIRQHGQKKAGEMLRAFAIEKQADLVFTVLGNPELDFARDDIKALTDAGILTLNWNCDDHWRFPYTSEWAPQYSHMVTTDPQSLERFKQLRMSEKILLSQWACNPFDYSPGVMKDIDVSFVGQPYGNRPAMIETLRKAGIHVVVHGAGWNDGQEIDFHQMLDVLRRSRIVLNFSRATQGDRRQIKARFFEIPACGSLMLTEPADGMDQYLNPGRHYDTFDSPDELVGKARQWLERPERDAWALEASAIVRSVHSYAWRLQEIFEAIGLNDRT